MLQWFKNLIRRNQYELTGNSWERALDFLGSPKSGTIRVNRDNVWGISSFRQGVELISTTVARCNCHVFERQDNEGRRRANDHPAYSLLRRSFNSHTTAFVGFRQLVANALWAGNGYAYIKKNGLAEPESLWILDPDLVAPVIVYTDDIPEIYYTYTAENRPPAIINASHLIHLRGLNTHDGITGMRLIDAAKETLGLAIAQVKYGSVWFSKGGGAGQLVIELPTTFKDEKAKAEFRASFKNLHSGIEGSFEPAILSGGAKLNRNSISHTDAQFIESRAASRCDVASLLSLPAHKLNCPVNSSYSSIEAENSALLSDCYDGWLVNLEQEIFSKLLTEREKREDTHYVEFDRNTLLRGDATSETNNLLNELNNGGLSWQEYRQRRNLSTIKDDSQEWRLPTSVVIPAEQEKIREQEAKSDLQSHPEPIEVPQGKSKEVIRASLNRLVERLAKDRPAGKDALIQRHSDTFNKSLPGCSTWIDTFFESLGEELEHVLPEQREAVIRRLDIDAMEGEIWKQEFAT